MSNRNGGRDTCSQEMSELSPKSCEINFFEEWMLFNS